MKVLQLKGHNPYLNLATEEYVFKHLTFDEDILILWRNHDSVILGRNQNAFEEVNVPYVQEHNIPVIRRISGGGTVFHDLGNINYSWITNDYKDKVSNYQLVTKPIVSALNQMGIPASFFGKSDLRIGQEKISGNAQSFYKNRMLHHGTILYSADLKKVSETLKTNLEMVTSGGVSSNRSRVTNIQAHLKTPMDIEVFEDSFIKKILNKQDIEEDLLVLHENISHEIERLLQEKYQQWDWNFGESPNCRFRRTSKELNASMIVTLHKGRIDDITIDENYTDYSKEMMESFLGARYKTDELLRVFHECILQGWIQEEEVDLWIRWFID